MQFITGSLRHKVLSRVIAFPLLLALSAVAIAEAGPPREARAHWLDRNTLVWPDAAPHSHVTLHTPAHALQNSGGQIVGESPSIRLDWLSAGLPEKLAARFPHLAGAPALRIQGISEAMIREILTLPLKVSARNTEGRVVDQTGVQIAGVLDDLFRYDGPLGATIEAGRPVFRLWAPTARTVTLLLYDDAALETVPGRHPMRVDRRSGVWRLDGEPGWNRRYYQYEVVVFMPETGRVETNRVTDPYSLSLSADSQRSQVVDLADPDLAPAGWNSLELPAFTAPEDMVIYELHLRDFSILDERVPAIERGTFLAFTRDQSHGMRHLARLGRAGLTHLHLLPVFDHATVPEVRSDQLELDRGALADVGPDSPLPQARVAEIKDRDGFNWGYDPWHYTVPEGSYATDPVGEPRIVEFRQMVAALSRLGLRVVMDVVYNHTHAAGRNPGSVLDQVVPGYYQRLDMNGAVETSTCCANTASEHRMMEKLMIDSVLTWARHYKVSGFRFDLMGHHSRENLLKLRKALDELTVREDGIDGHAIYLYGEGWNFGEVANDARFVQARQANMAGTGIGTFSDRLRDGARGGLYDAHPSTQGFINGLVVDPSEFTRGHGPGLEQMLLNSDWIRIGLAGDIADYRFQSASGERRRADEVEYNGAPAGYTHDPAENIAYVAAHDNETLFDANQLKLPRSTEMAHRVRVQTLASALVLLGQGVPFIHAGQEFLRSKSMDRDSFNSGDWFNAIDWSFERGNWGRGLPMAEKNDSHWSIMAPLLANPALAPTANDRRQAMDDFESLLRMRGTSRLFRLRSGAEIREHLRFHNTGPQQVPGLIVMSIEDPLHALGDRYTRIVTLFNARPERITFDLPAMRGVALSVHPLQIERMAGEFEDGRFSVPERSVAVFVDMEKTQGGDP